MLGEVDAELIEAIGIDVLPRNDYKRWTHESGLEMLVPGEFNVVADRAGSRRRFNNFGSSVYDERSE